MKILVISVTGGTRRCVVEHALQAGHEVTAFVRSPQKIAVRHERLRVVRGDVLQADTVLRAMQGQQAVSCTLGPAAGAVPGTVISGGAHNLIHVMAQTGVRREDDPPEQSRVGIVRPPKLKHMPGRGSYRVGQALNVNLPAGLAHADVADFMVKSATATDHLLQLVEIGY